MRLSQASLLLLLLCLHASSAWATICEKFLIEANAVAASTKYRLAPGEAVKMQFGDEPAQVAAVFLGRLVPLDGVAKEFAFYEPGRQLVHLILIEKTNIQRPTGEGISADDTAPLVRSINQEGGTCAAYSMFNCMRQMQLLGQDGNDVLKTELESEQGRSGLLVRIVNQLYIEKQNSSDVLTGLTTKYGYKSYEIPWNGKKSDLKDAIIKYLNSGWPILLKFDVPKTMSTTDYTIIDHAKEKELSKNLWVPKGIMPGKGQSHMVTVLGIFETDGKQMLLISDPNFQAPRLWDIDELKKANSASIQAYVIWAEKKP